MDGFSYHDAGYDKDLWSWLGGLLTVFLLKNQSFITSDDDPGRRIASLDINFLVLNFIRYVSFN